MNLLCSIIWSKCESSPSPITIALKKSHELIHQRGTQSPEGYSDQLSSIEIFALLWKLIKIFVRVFALSDSDSETETETVALFDVEAILELTRRLLKRCRSSAETI
jgi:hypothetical protein